MEKLRVDSGIKVIEVNDAGDTISFSISDASFFSKFADIIKFFESKRKEISQNSENFTSIDADEDEESNADNIIRIAKEYSDLCSDTCRKLDNLFGEGCCKKVFIGIDNPGIDLIRDFFEVITPIMKKFADERNAKIQLKYNNRRKGGRKGAGR